MSASASVTAMVPGGSLARALRANVASYDAWYVAVAEAVDLPLATLDRRLARADGARCRFLTPGDTKMTAER